MLSFRTIVIIISSILFHSIIRHNANQLSFVSFDSLAFYSRLK